MKLLAFACNNIWPFVDRTITVNFHDGRHIIKAPIGSGKSFLFFDGPVFALYKNADRPILSATAQQWWVKLLYKHNDTMLLCVRDITRSKSGNDTVKSSLYTVSDSTNSIVGYLKTLDLINQNLDFTTHAMSLGMRDHIVCKNETDVQQTLAPFLPPQEVFLTTTVLLQNSDNVFELAPAERISLLKEIFWFLDIDTATERISDEKKWVTALIKSRQFTDDVDKKLRSYLHDWYTTLEALTPYDQRIIEWVADGAMTQDKVTITWFGRDDARSEVLQTAQNTIANNLENTQRTLGELNAYHTTYKEHLTSKQTIENNLKKAHTDKATAEQLLSKSNQNSLEDHQKNKQAFENEYNTWLNKLPSSWFTTEERDFPLVRQNTQDLIQQGKFFAEQVKSQEVLVQQYATNLKEDEATLHTYHEQRQQLLTNYEQKKKFHCSKIEWDCPFIEHINTSFFETLKKNITSAEEHYTKKATELEKKKNASTIQEAQKQLTRLQWDIDTLKKSPYYTDHAIIKNAKQEYDALQARYKDILTLDATFLNQTREQEQARIALTQAQTNIAHYETLLCEREAKKEQLEKQWTTHNEESLQQRYKALQQDRDMVAKAQQTLTRIHDLVQQHKDAQRELKTLVEKEQLLNDLYRIFSKEIMIKVLEDVLPLFAEYINNLLAKIVHFTVHFQPKKTTSDKLELEITIRDHHGIRPVKSLSGWQKAILRLAWILAVAQMTNSEQLFLDETINNIDQETIGHVAEMLEDYTKLYDIPLYLVTHSQQLQNMSLRDDTIDLTENLSRT